MKKRIMAMLLAIITMSTSFANIATASESVALTGDELNEFLASLSTELNSEQYSETDLEQENNFRLWEDTEDTENFTIETANIEDLPFDESIFDQTYEWDELVDVLGINTMTTSEIDSSTVDSRWSDILGENGYLQYKYEGSSDGTFNYTTLIDGTYAVTGVIDKTITNCIVPSTHNGVNVTAIGNSAFSWCTELESITISENVRIIEKMAFGDTTKKLKTISFPSTLQYIGYRAFFCSTGIETLNFPDSLIYIGEEAFYCYSDDSLTSVTFGSGLETIEKTAFRNSKLLTTLNLPDSLISIGDSAFSSCTGVTHLSIGKNLQEIGDSAFSSLSSLSSISLNSSNPYFASSGNDLIDLQSQSLVLYAREHTATSYTVPDGITTLATSVFIGAENLKTITFSKQLENILTSQNTSFYYSYFEEFIVPADNPYFTTEDGVLFNKDKTSLVAYPPTKKDDTYTIPDSVLSLEIYAFQSSYLKNLIFNDKLETIGYRAFARSSVMTELTIPDTVTSIGSYACANSKLKRVVIGSGITELPHGLFFCGYSLTEVVLPDTLTNIDSSAFYSCYALTTLTIPKGVTTITSSAFEKCTALETLYIHDGVTSIEEDAFEECTNLTLMYAGDIFKWIEVDGLANIPEYVNVEILGIYSPDNGENGMETGKEHYYIYVVNSDFVCVPNTTITVGSVETQTGNNGLAYLDAPVGIQYITLEAEGYMERTIPYDCQAGAFKTIFLFPYEGKDGDPYVTMASTTDTYQDLTTQSEYFYVGNGNTIDFEVRGNWGYGTEDTYMVYQEGQDGNKGKMLYSDTGEFSFAPSAVFLPDLPIYLKIMNSNKVESPPILLQIHVVEVDLDALGGLADVDGFNPVDDVDVSTTEDADEEVWKLFDVSNFAFGALNKLPAELDISIGEDGKITTKIQVGLANLSKDGKSQLFSAAHWTSFKSEIDKKKQELKTISSALNYMKASGAKGAVFKSSGGWVNPELQMVGYCEVVMSKEGKFLESSGGFIIAASNTAKLTKQFLIYVVPVYVEVSGKVELQISGVLTYDNEKDSLDPNLDGALNITLAGGGGIGVSGLATLGLVGSGNLAVPFKETKEKGTVTLTLAAKWRLYLLFVFDINYTFLEKPIEFGKGKSYSLISDDEMSTQYIEETTISIANRDYSNNTTSWNTSPSPRTFSNGIVDQFTSLQSWVMPGTMPELVDVNGTKMILFHTDNAARDTGNNIVLMYSLFDQVAQSWTTPKPVVTSDTSDFYFKEYVNDDDLYIIWQKSNTTLSFEDTDDETEIGNSLSDLISQLDIIVAKWDSETQTFITDFVDSNDKLDSTSVLAFNNSTPTALWLQNSRNDYSGLTGVNEVKVSTYENGEWSSPENILETENQILEIAGGYIDGKLHTLVSYSLGAGTGNIYYIKDGNAVLIDGQLDYGQSIQFHDNNFYWVSAGILYVYDPVRDSISTMTSGDDGISFSYRLVENETDTAIVWLSITDDDEGETISIIKASIKEADGTWSEPITLLTGEDYMIQYIDVELNNDGSWEFVLNTYVEDGEDVIVSLSYAKVAPKSNSILIAASTYEDEREGYLQPVELIFYNSGQSTIENVVVEVYDQAKKQYHKETLALDVPAGSYTNIDILVDVSSILEETNLTIKAYAENEDDLADNTYDITLGCVDVDIKLVKYMVDDNVVLEISVTNDLPIPANPTIKIRENAFDGNVIHEKEISNLTNDSTYVYTYTLDRNEINFGDDSSKLYYVTLETKETNLSYGDVYEFFILYPPISTSGLPQTTEFDVVTLVDVQSLEMATSLEFDLYQDFINQEDLDLIVKPENATNPAVSFHSSDISIATVNTSGIVTAVGVGQATITATSLENEKIVATTSIKVTDTTPELAVVTFNTQGGSEVAPLYVNDFKTLDVLPVTKKENYTFSGWSKVKSGDSLISEATTFESDTILYAHWDELAYNITFDSNNGSAIQSQMTNGGGTLEFLPTATKTDSDFVGWYDDKEKISLSTIFTNDTTVLARWSNDDLDNDNDENSDDNLEDDLDDDLDNDLDNDTDGNSDNNFNINRPSSSSNGNSGYGSSVSSASTTTQATQEVELDTKLDNVTSAMQEYFDSFTDIATHWANESICFMLERGLMNGVDTGVFSPDTSITRGMLVTVLGRLSGIDLSTYTTSAFDDVDQDTYYSQAISWAKSSGIVNGISDSEFAPDEPITREQMAVILYQYMIQAELILPYTAEKTEFTDNEDINSWATTAVSEMQQLGILNGKLDMLFDAQGTGTRAEFSAMMQRFIVAVEEYMSLT